jgi:hypothetical protein
MGCRERLLALEADEELRVRWWVRADEELRVRWWVRADEELRVRWCGWDVGCGEGGGGGEGLRAGGAGPMVYTSYYVM